MVGGSKHANTLNPKLAVALASYVIVSKTRILKLSNVSYVILNTNKSIFKKGFKKIKVRKHYLIIVYRDGRGWNGNGINYFTTCSHNIDFMFTIKYILFPGKVPALSGPASRGTVAQKDGLGKKNKQANLS